MPNQLQIKQYINYYQKILEKWGFELPSTQLDVLFPVINLIFEIDSLYDAKEASFSPVKVKELREKMTNLLSESLLMTESAIERFSEAMELESQNIKPDSLQEYLQVSRYSIGAEILGNYVAYLLKIPVETWFSQEISQFRTEIYTLIRLANDYLDVKEDQARRDQEKEQVKATQFFPHLLFFKIYFYWLYASHKLHYCYQRAKYQFFSINQDTEHYLKAIICAESLLVWAYKVYVIDKNSVHDF